jgi:DNA-binding LacI/PurR family transcriptional regulator
MKPVTNSSHPTIRDVARHAGVSPGTVSRVLNNSPLVKETTRQRVWEVIESLNYTPNLIARRLSLGKSLRIAVIVPFFTRPAEVERLRGVVNHLAHTQYDLVIHNIETPEQRATDLAQIPYREWVDGVLVISLPPEEEFLPRLKTAEVPIVFVDVHHPELRDFDLVNGDDVRGGYLAARHLIDLGHRRIGFIGDLPDHPLGFTSSRDRFEGFRNALAEANIPYDSNYHAESVHGQYLAQMLAEKMLTLPSPPTAIFAASDTQAMGVLTAARHLRIPVPEHLSIIGFDDIQVAEYLGLTTIRQNLYASGKAGVELLLERMIDPKIERRVVEIPNELIIRSTTFPPNS